MIKIINAEEVEDSFFNGRDFGKSIETVREVLKDVQLRKDQALHEYTKKFDVSNPCEFEIPQSELKAAAERMEKNNPELYKSLCYSHDLALKFALKQKESFDDFEVELEEGVKPWVAELLDYYLANSYFFYSIIFKDYDYERNVNRLSELTEGEREQVEELRRFCKE